MVERGYLQKKEDPKDKRATLIYLTPKADEIRHSLEKINSKMEKRMLSGLNEKEKKQLIIQLKQLKDNLEKENPDS